jgi:hypothetical protein
MPKVAQVKILHRKSLSPFVLSGEELEDVGGVLEKKSVSHLLSAVLCFAPDQPMNTPVTVKMPSVIMQCSVVKRL